MRSCPTTNAPMFLLSVFLLSLFRLRVSRSLVFIAMVLLFVTGGPLAYAEDTNVDAARAAEARGRVAFREQRFTDAAKDFAAAFKLDPKANTKYNEGLAWGKAGLQPPEADALAAALAFGGLKEELTTKANESLRELKGQLGQLIVTEPLGARISVAHADGVGVPARVYLSPGKHTVTIRYKDGSDEAREIAIVAGDDTRLLGTAKKPSDEPKASPLPVVVPPDGDIGLALAGWSSVGLGALALIGSGVVGGLTLSKVSQYDDTGNTDLALHDEAVMLKTTTNVLVGVGGGLVVLGAILLIVDSVGGDSTDAVAITPDGFAVRF